LAGYIVMQFKNFRDPGRQDPHATAAMYDVAHSVNDDTLAVLAAYYAQQAPTLAQNGGPLAEKGKMLFAKGDPAEGLAACQTCHGVQAQGRGNAPRLAGQHAEYLKNQLIRLRFGLRASEVMHPNTNAMTDAQIDGLVAWLANR
jgi:cytochrome c553